MLRQFFRFARTQKIVLTDPTRGLSARQPAGFTGQTVLLERQRELFRRWTAGRTPTRTRPCSGSSPWSTEPPASRSAACAWTTSTTVPGPSELGKRPRPVPLDPASWDVLQRCLTHRDAQATGNPHVMVTRGTRARRSPASVAYVSHVLDPCGVPPRMLRSTRLIDLVNTMDPNSWPPRSAWTPKAS